MEALEEAGLRSKGASKPAQDDGSRGSREPLKVWEEGSDQARLAAVTG